MTFSISKMLKDSFGAFFNNISFLLTIIAITTVAELSLEFLFYSFSFDVLGNVSIRNILCRQLLSYCLPRGFYASPHIAVQILFGLLGGFIAAFRVLIVCQVALCMSEKTCSYWKILQRSLSPLLSLRLLLWSCFVYLFALVISFPFVVFLSMSLVDCAAAWPAMKSILLEYLPVALGIVWYQWVFFRLAFAIPHIFEGNSVFASIKKSLKETKQLPASVFLVNFLIIMLTNLPLFLAWLFVVDWQLSALILVLLIFYGSFIEVLRFFLVLAPWHQINSN